jgi:hypothetical protein
VRRLDHLMSFIAERRASGDRGIAVDAAGGARRASAGMNAPGARQAVTCSRAETPPSRSPGPGALALRNRGAARRQARRGARRPRPGTRGPAALVYAEQVVKVLRLYPPASPSAARRWRTARSVATASAKATVFMSQWAMRGHFFAHQAFRPDAGPRARGGARYATALRRQARVCINRFAMMEAVLLLATIVGATACGWRRRRVPSPRSRCGRWAACQCGSRPGSKQPRQRECAHKPSSASYQRRRPLARRRGGAGHRGAAWARPRHKLVFGVVNALIRPVMKLLTARSSC